MDPAISSEPGASGTGAKTTGAYTCEYQSVAPSVERVSALFELDSPETMHLDAAAVDARLPRVVPRLAYTDLYTGYPTDQPKRDIEITEAAQRLANALHLHLD
jgi:hypothetical protein